MSKLKEVYFIKFELKSNYSSDTLSCDLEFTAQTPTNQEVLERAILIKLNGKDDENFRLETVCRIIYEFDSKEQIPDDDDFMKEYHLDAYAHFCEKANGALKILGNIQLPFPDIE